MQKKKKKARRRKNSIRTFVSLSRKLRLRVVCFDPYKKKDRTDLSSRRSWAAHLPLVPGTCRTYPDKITSWQFILAGLASLNNTRGRTASFNHSRKPVRAATSAVGNFRFLLYCFQNNLHTSSRAFPKRNANFFSIHTACRRLGTDTLLVWKQHGP